MSVLSDLYEKMSESVTHVITDGIETVIAEKVATLLDWVCKMFFEGFGPDIGSFLKYFDQSATTESLTSINGWVGFSFENTTSPAIKIFAVFALIAFVLAILMFVWGVIKCTFMPFIQTKDTPLKVTVRFAIAVLAINFSIPLMQIAFDVTQDVWNSVLKADITAASASENISKVAESFATDPTEMGNGDIVDSGADIDTGKLLVGAGAFASVTGGGSIVAGGLIIYAIAALILIYELFKFMMEIIERYMVAAFMYMMFPVVVPTIIMEETLSVFKSFIRMLLCQLFLILMNLMFVRMFISMVATMAGDPKPMTFFIMMAFLKAAQRLDSYMHMMGLNTAVTGGELFDSAAASARSLMGLGKSLAHAGGAVGGALGVGEKSKASNGAQIRSGENAATAFGRAANVNKTGSEMMKAGAETKNSLGGSGLDMSNPLVKDKITDGSIAGDLLTGDARAYRELNNNAAKEAVTMQAFDKNSNGDTWEGNKLTKTIGADDLQGVRLKADGSGLENGAKAIFKNKDGNEIDSMDIVGSTTGVKNEIAQIEMPNGEIMHIGNASSEGIDGAKKGSGLASVGSANINTNWKDIQARTGWSKADIQAKTGTVNAETGQREGVLDFDGARYNASIGAMELYKGQKAVGAVVENNGFGEQEVVAYPPDNDISQMDVRFTANNRLDNINMDNGLYQSDDGYQFDTADERNSHEYQISSSESGVYGSIAYDNYSVGEEVNGNYFQTSSGAEMARAIQDDVNRGVYGDLGGEVQSAVDYSSMHKNTENDARYRNGTVGLTFDNGDHREAHIIRNSNDLAAVHRGEAKLYRGTNGQVISLVNKGKETIPKRRDTVDKPTRGGGSINTSRPQKPNTTPLKPNNNPVKPNNSPKK